MSSHPDALGLVGKLAGGRFRVVQHLGSGGTGHVYLAERVEDRVAEPHARSAGGARERVALKVLRPEHRQGSALARFSREAYAAALVTHDNVLRIVEAHVEDPETPFFAMELLVGLDLADTLSYARPLSPARAARIAHAAAAGLAAAHAAGVVHADVKPENLFLVHAADGREVVKLVDFGFAWVASDGASADRDDADPHSRSARPSRRVVAGTPEYMAPEQAAGVRGDPRSDVYSLGIVLYEMLTGRTPFTGTYPLLAERHARQPMPPLRAVRRDLVVSTEMEVLVARCLAKEPEARFESAGALRDALGATREASGVFRRDDLIK